MKPPPPKSVKTRYSIATSGAFDTENAIGLIVNGYAKEVLNKLPMEFAVEAQKLLADQSGRKCWIGNGRDKNSRQGRKDAKNRQYIIAPLQLCGKFTIFNYLSCLNKRFTCFHRRKRDSERDQPGGKSRRSTCHHGTERIRKKYPGFCSCRAGRCLKLPQAKYFLPWARTCWTCHPKTVPAKGSFLGFQYPVEIPGVTMVNFMKTAVNEAAQIQRT